MEYQTKWFYVYNLITMQWYQLYLRIKSDIKMYRVMIFWHCLITNNYHDHFEYNLEKYCLTAWLIGYKIKFTIGLSHLLFEEVTFTR